MGTPARLRGAQIKVILFELFDLVAYIIFVAGLVFFIRFFIINPFNVVGSSMFPTIKEEDFIIVDKISGRIKEYQRGDIIVFVPPGKDVPYVKRIIGLPGETVTVKDNTVTICSKDDQDCSILQQDFLPTGTITEANCGKTSFEVTGGYFVMGDNRGASTDSRCCFGLYCYEHTNYIVPDSHILGKVLVRILPKLTTFDNPFK